MKGEPRHLRLLGDPADERAAAQCAALLAACEELGLRIRFMRVAPAESLWLQGDWFVLDAREPRRLPTWLARFFGPRWVEVGAFRADDAEGYLEPEVPDAEESRLVLPLCAGYGEKLLAVERAVRSAYSTSR